MLNTSSRLPAHLLSAQGERASTPARISISRVNLLLGVQSLVVILLSINRLADFTQGAVAPNQFLRWVDLHNMLTLPLISLVAFFLLKRELEAAAPAHAQRALFWLGLGFTLGIYLFGVGYGAHEVTNSLHVRFCTEAGVWTPGDGSLCSIIAFNDDEFSHWIWFAGFVLINAMLMLLQTQSADGSPAKGGAAAILLLNALIMGLAIVANLAFEPIGADLYIVALLALLALFLLRRQGVRPLFTYYAAAYLLGLAVTAAFKLLA